MKITGQLDTDGNPMPFTEEIEVTEFITSLRDKDGICWALKDEYGDWVSPTMYNMGVKSIMVVTE